MTTTAHERSNPGWIDKPLRAIMAAADRVEQWPWGSAAIGVLLLAIIATRHLLEIGVAKNPIYTDLATFVHYPLAYVAPFLALSLTLASWARWSPLRVVRLMTLAWVLTLTPPLLDLLLHRGAKPSIAYLVAEPIDLPAIWLQFFDPRQTLAGTTLGIRLEALAAVLLGAVYVFGRTRSWWRALGCALCVYLVSLFFFSLPVLMVALLGLLMRAPLDQGQLLRGEALLHRVEAASAPDSAAIAWLVPLMLLLVAWWGLLTRNRETNRQPPLAAPWFAATLFVVALAVSGAMHAIWLNLPVGNGLLLAPYDLLGGLALLLALSLGCYAAFAWGQQRLGSVWWALALALAAGSGLGRSPLLGLLVVWGALAVWSGALFPRSRWSPLVGALCWGTIAVGALVAGYALVIGPEALARLPVALYLPVALGGAVLGTIWSVVTPASPLWSALAAALALGLGVLPLGVPAFAIAAGLLGAAAGWFAPLGGSGRTSSHPRRALAPLLGLALLGIGFAVDGNERVRPELVKQATCVPEVFMARGQQREADGKWALAKGDYAQALHCAPESVDALRALGLGFLRYDNDLTRAISHLERAQRAAPDSIDERINLASAYLAAKRSAEALAILDGAAPQREPHRAWLFNRAQALEDLGRNDEARTAWTDYLRAAGSRMAEATNAQQARQHLRALERKGTTPPAQ